MKTFPAVAILVICSIVPFFLDGSVANVIPQASSQGHFCHSYETECKYGCCPLANATCCSDGLQCCPHGDICLSDRGLCMSPRTDSEALASVRANRVVLPTSVDENSSRCPPRTISCGENKCCLYRDGTCCEDGLHCCPHNYECDLSQERCYMHINNEVTSNLDVNNETTFTRLFKAIDKSPFHICPNDRFCPSYTYCCSEDTILWGCCAKPWELEIDQDDTCQDYPETETEAAWQ